MLMMTMMQGVRVRVHMCARNQLIARSSNHIFTFKLLPVLLIRVVDYCVVYDYN